MGKPPLGARRGPEIHTVPYSAVVPSSCWRSGSALLSSSTAAASSMLRSLAIYKGEAPIFEVTRFTSAAWAMSNRTQSVRPSCAATKTGVAPLLVGLLTLAPFSIKKLHTA